MSPGDSLELQGASLVIRPNRSLPVAGMVLLFASFCVWMLAMSAAFALAGIWMVLPFAGVEVLALGWLCRWFYRHRDDCDLVTIAADQVSVVQRRGDAILRSDFPRPWIRVRLDARPGAAGCQRLLLGSHGRFVVLGEEINDADRALAADALRKLLGAA